jgi:hypothetical protein
MNFIIIIVIVSLIYILILNKNTITEKFQRNINLGVGIFNNSNQNQNQLNDPNLYTFYHPSSNEVSTVQGIGQINYPTTQSYDAFPLLKSPQPILVPKRTRFDPRETENNTPKAFREWPKNTPFDKDLNSVYKIRDNELNVFKELDTNLQLPDGMYNPDLRELRGEFYPTILMRPSVRTW